jgi:diaminopropionate ammonia-lyase
VLAVEIRQQIEAASHRRPTHLFVQAGVGGLAAAMAEGLKDWMAPPAMVIVIEPATSACVATALAQGRVVRIPGDLHTAAEMLSCGEASVPAVEILRRHNAEVVTVLEDDLADGPRLLQEEGGPATTPSGAAGLAGLQRVLKDNMSVRLSIDADSRVLIVITEGDLGSQT